MGRSAKLMKRPTQKQKSASKIAKEASKPLAKQEYKPQPVVEQDEDEPAQSNPKHKKRKMLRAKAEQKVGPAERSLANKAEEQDSVGRHDVCQPHWPVALSIVQPRPPWHTHTHIPNA